MMQELMQTDLESLIRSYPAGIQLILKYDEVEAMYYLYYALNNDDSFKQRQIFTQRKKPKTFKDISRAIEWGRSLGFASVNFTHEWTRQNV